MTQVSLDALAASVNPHGGLTIPAASSAAMELLHLLKFAILPMMPDVQMTAMNADIEKSLLTVNARSAQMEKSQGQKFVIASMSGFITFI